MSEPRTVLIVDDQFLLALDMADIVEEQGHRVQGPFAALRPALTDLEKQAPDTALLDINLGDGDTTEPIARLLMSKGIPFAFITGYGAVDVLPPDFSEVERLRKPASTRDVRRLVDRLLAS